MPRGARRWFLASKRPDCGQTKPYLCGGSFPNAPGIGQKAARQVWPETTQVTGYLQAQQHLRALKHATGCAAMIPGGRTPPSLPGKTLTPWRQPPKRPRHRPKGEPGWRSQAGGASRCGPPPMSWRGRKALRRTARARDQGVIGLCSSPRCATAAAPTAGLPRADGKPPRRWDPGRGPWLGENATGFPRPCPFGTVCGFKRIRRSGFER